MAMLWPNYSTPLKKEPYTKTLDMKTKLMIDDRKAK